MMLTRESFRTGGIEATGRVLHWLLSAAFVLSYYTRVGTALIIALCAWYLALNIEALRKDRWALAVIVLFALVAAKDGAMLLAGSGSFKAFAKSGSRVFVLAGCAAMLDAHRGERIERMLLLAFGITAAAMGAIFALMRFGAIPAIYNPNLFGMQALWFPLALAVRMRDGGLRPDAPIVRKYIAAAAILLGGVAILFADGYLAGASFPGSRTAPFALATASVFALLPRKRLARVLAAGVVVAALIGIAVLSRTYSEKLDNLLASRQQLWNAFAAKGAERPLTGWGYTDVEENRAIVAESMKGKSYYEAEMLIGSGPHNAFLAMFFENGILFLLAYAGLLVARLLKSSVPAGFFDVSLLAYIVLMSADAMSPGGVTFLGFFLGMCLLSVGGRRGASF